MPQTDDHRGGSLSEMQTGLIQKDLIHPLLATESLSFNDNNLKQPLF